MPSPRRPARSSVSLVSAAVLLAACADLPEPPDAAQEARADDGIPSIDVSGGPAFPLDAHLESADIAAGRYTAEELIEMGAQLFRTAYNGYDGVGIARRPDGTPVNRFAVAPGGGQVSSQSCVECHNLPGSGGAGLASTNRIGDPDGDGNPPFIVRSTTSLWGNGLLQLLAQEMTEDLHAIRDDAAEAARAEPGSRTERELTTKGVSYGTIAVAVDADGELSWELAGLEGVDPDLVVRPLGWKGHLPTARLVAVGAAAGLMGMIAEEAAWFPPPGVEYAPDPDGDGVERELSVGDVTALAVYGTAQPTPQSLQRLAELGMVHAPDASTLTRIERGREVFQEIGCAECHVPALRLEDTVFEEPTLRGNGNYYDARLAERDEGYDPARPVRYDLLTAAEEPRVEAHPDGGAVVRAYGDLKRHDMGRQLADTPGPEPAITAGRMPLVMDGDTVQIAPSVFLTKELWGVGSTGPWLHDGRAATLAEAVIWHGEDEPPPPGSPGRSEAQESRDAFAQLGDADREAVLTFLRSLRAYSPPPDPS